MGCILIRLSPPSSTPPKLATTLPSYSSTILRGMGKQSLLQGIAGSMVLSVPISKPFPSVVRFVMWCSHGALQRLSNGMTGMPSFFSAPPHTRAGVRPSNALGRSTLVPGPPLPSLEHHTLDRGIHWTLSRAPTLHPLPTPFVAQLIVVV